MQKNFVEKLASIRTLIASRLPQVDMRNLQELMGKLAHYHYHRRDCLIFGVERDLYSLLTEQGHNPFTVYRWLLLEHLPEDIRFQIKQRRLSQKKGIAEGFKRRHEGRNELSQSIREYGLSLIARM